ncbi:MAG: cupin-like domain-containing protein [Flavobacterium sp.]
MKIIFGLCIFCVVLFIYLHVQFHLKTAEDLEMYEVDQPSKERLEEICDIRQPVLFDFECDKIMETTNRQYIANHYHAFELKIRNVHETNEHADLYVPLPVHASIKLFDEDKTAAFFTENNSDFLDETGVVKNMRYNDEFLRPYMVSNCNYDLMLGAPQTCSPFRYEVNYRNYFLMTHGKAQIKLAPPHSTRYLSPIYDYENFEFRSPVNPWKPQPKYSADFDKIKCLEFTLIPGKTLYIPAYWWYSIQFQEDTSISCFRYRTYMNNLAISPYIAMFALQIQNVKRDTMKKINIQALNEAPPKVEEEVTQSE